MKAIQKIAAEKDFDSVEDFERFLNEQVVGSSPEELAAMLESDEPLTPLEQADRLIDNIPDDATPEERTRTAKQALMLSQDCTAAWLEFAMLEEDDGKAMDAVEQGLARGRVRFKKQIESAPTDGGLWGWIEARAFMRLLHEKARIHGSLGDEQNVIATYREMLALNPDDNQGIREDLLLILTSCHQLDEARTLLDAYPDDTGAAMIYGRAFLNIVETMERTGFEPPAPDSPGLPSTASGWFKRLGPEFAPAERDLKRAVKRHPFVPLFISHPGLLEVETPDMVLRDGPYATVVYAQKWSVLWNFTELPFILLNLLTPKNPSKLIDSQDFAEELEDVIVQLESHVGPPWWEELETAADRP